MLKLYNTLGNRLEKFVPVHDKLVTVFTCGPSVYQRAHIGNFRTFLFEDVLVRYLEYSGYRVTRGMNFTDVEDKAIREARNRCISIRDLTDDNISKFLEEMNLLRIKIPDYLPRASESVEEAVEIIEELLEKEGIAYWHQGNVYFDPLRYPGFGELYGLDMRRWPSEKRRFHRDTYPGMRWNLGDFIIWHGGRDGEISWETRIGRGRPAWNVQDPSMMIKHFRETLSVYCGGIDNLIRHHDYSRAILESIRSYPMARYWLHCHHLYVDGDKMSKSKGNLYYTDTVLAQGYGIDELRFFLIYGHYRRRLNYSERNMKRAAGRLRAFKRMIRDIADIAKGRGNVDNNSREEITKIFTVFMNNDLDVKSAVDALFDHISRIDISTLSGNSARGILKEIREVDKVLQVLFEG